MKHPTWHAVTERDYNPSPEAEVGADPRSKPVEFVLTPGDRDRAALAKVQLERNRRRLNSVAPKGKAA